MRTAIFLGLTSIADAIRKDWFSTNQEIVGFTAFIFLCMMIMDIADFFKNMSKKN